VKLTSLLKVEPKKDAAANDVPVEVDQSFTPEQLQAVWNEFAEQRKNLPAEYQLLTQPYDFTHPVITVHLHHLVQETMLNNIRLQLSAFIRERLKNTSIQIVTKIVEIDESKRVFYTPREKFDHLLEKNPVLREMKDRLGLDTDF
jgi:DNA polymerase-3 subunit gamma/tau